MDPAAANGKISPGPSIRSALGGQPPGFSNFETLQASLRSRKVCRSEADEQNHLVRFVLQRLDEAGLLSCDASGNPAAGTDVKLTRLYDDGSEKTSACIEIKSTHNFLLPLLASGIANAFNTHCTKERSADITLKAQYAWTRLGHPIGQVLGYMEEEKVRFGVLSSATRTYFLRLVPARKVSAPRGKKKHKLEITNAWHIGQKNYLRAWAYFAHTACCELEGDWRVDTSEWFGTPEKETGPAGDGDKQNVDSGERSARKRKASPRQSKRQSKKQSNSTSKQSKMTSNASSAPTKSKKIPLISRNEVELIRPLGHGRNGTVYLGKWQGDDVAVKQFDISKSGSRHYEKELEAYSLLCKAWGTLVPTPKFRCECFPFSYLGLQLGRSPRQGDNVSGWQGVLQKLKNNFGFVHMDTDEHDNNMLFIPRETGRGERLVAIDLETYELVNHE